MRDTARQGPKEFVTRETLDRLKAALARIAKSKDSSRDPLICSVCHNLVALETRDICADENGRVVHTDCCVQQTIAASRQAQG